jgi:hypothetical protein
MLDRLLRNPLGRWAFILVWVISPWVLAYVIVMHLPSVVQQLLLLGIVAWFGWAYRNKTWCIICDGIHDRPFCGIENRSFLFPRQRS